MHPCYACGERVPLGAEICPTCGAVQVAGDTARLTAVSGAAEPPRSNTSPLHPVRPSTGPERPVSSVEAELAGLGEFGEMGEPEEVRHDTAPYPAVLFPPAWMDAAVEPSPAPPLAAQDARPQEVAEGARPRASTLKDPRLQAAFERGLTFDEEETTTPTGLAGTHVSAFDATSEQPRGLEPTADQVPPMMLASSSGPEPALDRPPSSSHRRRVPTDPVPMTDHRMEPTLREVSPIDEELSNAMTAQVPAVGPADRPRIEPPPGHTDAHREPTAPTTPQIVVPHSKVEPHRPAPLTAKIAAPHRDDDVVVAGKTPIGLWVAIVLVFGLGVGVLVGAGGLYFGWFDPTPPTLSKADAGGKDASADTDDNALAQSDDDAAPTTRRRRRKPDAEAEDATPARAPEDAAGEDAASDTASPADAAPADVAPADVAPEVVEVAADAAPKPAPKAPDAGPDASPAAERTPAVSVGRIWFEPRRIGGFVHGKADLKTKPTRTSWEAIQIAGIDVLILTGDRRGKGPAAQGKAVTEALSLALERHATARRGRIEADQAHGKPRLVWRGKGAEEVVLIELEPAGVAELARFNRRAFGEFLYARHLADFISDVFDLVVLGKPASRIAEPAFRAVADRFLSLPGAPSERLALLPEEERAAFNRQAWQTPAPPDPFAVPRRR